MPWCATDLPWNRWWPPSPSRGVSALAVQIGREIILFDCGEGTQRQFMLSPLSFMRVNNIFITHYHGDHFLGLPGLIQSMNFSGRENELHVYGPEGNDRDRDRRGHARRLPTSFRCSRPRDGRWGRRGPRPMLGQGHIRRSYGPCPLLHPPGA